MFLSLYFSLKDFASFRDETIINSTGYYEKEGYNHCTKFFWATKENANIECHFNEMPTFKSLSVFKMNDNGLVEKEFTYIFGEDKDKIRYSNGDNRFELNLKTGMVSKNFGEEQRATEEDYKFINDVVKVTNEFVIEHVPYLKKYLSSSIELDSKTMDAPNGYQAMILNFASDNFESKNMIDFLTKYGKIEYKDSSGKLKSMDIDFLIKRKYLGKILYIKIPNNVAESKYIAIKIVLRTKTYNCMLT